AMVKTREKEGRALILHEPLPATYGDLLIDYCRQHCFHLNYYLNDVLYARGVQQLKKYARIYSRQTGAVVHFVPDLKVFRGKSPTKLILITDVVNEKEPFRTRDSQYEFFQKKLGGQVNLFRTNPEYLEFLKKGVGKAAGLVKLAEFYRINKADTIAFGDGENDAEMLAVAGIGVAMANAAAKTKECAKVILPWSNSQAGVAKFLENLARESV
ncbi:MAG: HAD-IIB family hydrolase, partial [Candidatus Omnitrophica bacterium]|nr:HAD-IIB family hydrolase [Candidatus Omnitrophota bacterium]